MKETAKRQKEKELKEQESKEQEENIIFEDLFDIKDIQRLQDEFALATGVASIITHTDGTPITRPSKFCRLCNDIIRKTTKGCANCYHSDAVLGRLNPDGPIIQPCMSGGLWDAGAAISVGGKHIANWLIGQVRDETQTEKKMREYAKEIGANEEEFIIAFLEVPGMSRKRFGEVSQMLFTFANQLSTLAYHNLQQKRFIIERKKAEEEREKLRSQLTQSQKMESIGRLAGGVAHDFNNMLGVIIGYADIALDQIDSKHPLYTHLQEIRKAAERSANLTQQLLAFARKQTISPKILDLNKVVEGMLKMLRRLIGEDIDLVWIPAKSLWTIKMDPTQIDQILANLCVNARDAIAGVGKIIIETRSATFASTYCAEHVGFLPGDYVMLSVSDDGCGMAKETMDKLFEPFFTTKELGQGTGLGLSTVYGIVKQNNGFVTVYSELNKGSTFNIYLPRYIEAVDVKAENGKIIPAKRGQESILLVEDEPAILKMTTTMLKRLGYTVIAASTPKEAIRLSKKHSEELRLLITDVIMPEMTGRELAKKVLEDYPNLKCLFMSGYTANIIGHHGVLEEDVKFIQKPFVMQELAAKIREVLDEK